MKEIKSPKNITAFDSQGAEVPFKIFLAGSIEQDSAEEWQFRLINEFAGYDVVFLNPRRQAWDASWRNSIDEPQFVEQVNWELDAIDASDLVVMYLQPGTKSPVCCPEGYWRKGNVDIVCDRFNIPVLDSWAELIETLREVLKPLKV